MSSVMRFDEWQDSDGNPVYDGSGGPLATPAILQVVFNQTSAQVTNNTDTFVDTGVTATITPSSVTSNILIFTVNNGVWKRNGNTQARLQLLRDGTILHLFEQLGANTNNTSQIGIGSSAFYDLDSPGTTSPVTYKTQFQSQQNIAEVRVQVNGAVSSIVLMEVPG